MIHLRHQRQPAVRSGCLRITKVRESNNTEEHGRQRPLLSRPRFPNRQRVTGLGPERPTIWRICSNPSPLVHQLCDADHRSMGLSPIALIGRCGRRCENGQQDENSEFGQVDQGSCGRSSWRRERKPRHGHVRKARAESSQTRQGEGEPGRCCGSHRNAVTKGR